jgi:hypothetical protein
MVSLYIGLRVWKVHKASWSVDISRIAKEIEGTKIGGRFSFHFTSSKATIQI